MYTVINAFKCIHLTIQLGWSKQTSNNCALHTTLTSDTPRRSAVKGLLPLNNDRKQPTEGMKVNTPGMHTPMTRGACLHMY